jgi:hypothetical protein
LIAIVRLGTAALIAAAVTTLLVDLVRRDGSVINLLSFFTIDSNLIAMATLLAGGRMAAAGRSSQPIVFLRGCATLYMTITGVVYVLLLRNVDVQVPFEWANVVLHYIAPVVMVVDWAVLERPAVDVRGALGWLVFPIVWLGYTLVRGEVVGWYPYPFLDVREHGYAGVAATALGVAAFAFVVLWILVVIADSTDQGTAHAEVASARP